MLYISICEDEKKYFKDLLNGFPENVLLKTEHGFDMSSSAQVVINVADIATVMIPSIIAAVEMVLVYRIQKYQNKLKEKEIELQKREFLFEKNKSEQSMFEIKITNGQTSEIIVKTANIESLIESSSAINDYLEELKTQIGEIHE